MTMATAVTTMTGGGDYDRNARVQATAASFALPLLERAAQAAALPARVRANPAGARCAWRMAALHAERIA
jgi:hypothetical protein